MTTASEKSALYDLARVVTTLLVVFAHGARMYTAHGVYAPVLSSRLMAGVHDVIYGFHMPFFVFLSGCVYGCCIEDGKYRDIRSFLGNKSQKLLIPYIFFGIAYVAPAMILLGLTDQTYGGYLFDGILLSQNSRHLWFILALFWIFLLAVPVSKIPLRGPAKTAAVMAVSGTLYACARFVPDYFQLYNAMTYQLYFFAGMVFHDLYEAFGRIPQNWRCGLFVISMLTVLTAVFPGSGTFLRLFRAFSGIFMMIVLLQTILRRYPQICSRPLFALMKKNSFGIYLFHPMILYWLFSRLAGLKLLPTALVTATSMIALAASILATCVLRRLHLQILIGEHNRPAS